MKASRSQALSFPSFQPTMDSLSLNTSDIAMSSPHSSAYPHHRNVMCISPNPLSFLDNYLLSDIILKSIAVPGAEDVAAFVKCTDMGGSDFATLRKDELLKLAYDNQSLYKALRKLQQSPPQTLSALVRSSTVARPPPALDEIFPDIDIHSCKNHKVRFDLEVEIHEGDELLSDFDEEWSPAEEFSLPCLNTTVIPDSEQLPSPTLSDSGSDYLSDTHSTRSESESTDITTPSHSPLATKHRKLAELTPDGHRLVLALAPPEYSQFAFVEGPLPWFDPFGNSGSSDWAQLSSSVDGY